MQLKLLKDVVVTIAGPSAAGIVDLLYGKKNVNEFNIAKKLNMNINQARNILYKLSDEGLVSFIGKKDKKNGGWYTYFWTLDTGKSLVALRNILAREIDALELQLKSRQHENFYHCVNCDVELNEEQALLNNFICPECGEVLQLRENSVIMKEIERKLVKFRQELGIVQAELDTVSHKASALRTRRMKAEEKKTKEARKKARAATKKAKANDAKKPVKKVPKKRGKK